MTDILTVVLGVILIAIVAYFISSSGTTTLTTEATKSSGKTRRVDLSVFSGWFGKILPLAVIGLVIFLAVSHTGREMAMEYVVTPGWDVMSGGDTVICKMAITKMRGGILEDCELPAGYWTFTVEKPVEKYRWTANGLPGPGGGMLAGGDGATDLSQLKYKNTKSYGALLVRSASQGTWSISGNPLIHPEGEKMALEWTINIERPHLKTARTVSAINAVLKFKRHGS